jgi:hypothetical protein
MSRINRPPIQDGDEVAAAGLNVRYGDFSQSDINQFNTRDGAIDLPQFELPSRHHMARVATSVQIGKSDFYHDAPVVLNGQTALPSTPYVIGDGVSDTVLGPLNLALVTVDDTNVLRVYWSLNVEPRFTGTPWTTASTPSATYEVAQHGGGNKGIVTNGTCWVIYLQWDITSPALTNWTEVPYQGDFDTNPTGTIRGELLENTAATTVVPAWVTRHDADNREADGNTVATKIGWRGVSGHYTYDSSMAGNVTVYGLRLVVKGPMHPFNHNGRNYLVQQPDIVSQAGTNLQLAHTVGRLGFILHRTK